MIARKALACLPSRRTALSSTAELPVPADFAARIARIEQGVGSSKRTLYVGVDETYRIPERMLRHAPSPRRAGLATVLALVLGGLAVEGSLLAQDGIIGLIGPAPGAALQLLQLVCIGVLLAIILTRTLGLRGRGHTLAMVLGAGLGTAAVLFTGGATIGMADLQEVRGQVLPHSLSLGDVKLQF